VPIGWLSTGFEVALGGFAGLFPNPQSAIRNPYSLRRGFEVALWRRNPPGVAQISNLRYVTLFASLGT
jgi:hypothetical protein